MSKDKENVYTYVLQVLNEYCSQKGPEVCITQLKWVAWSQSSISIRNTYNPVHLTGATWCY
jgi:hypothetical protein